jgi:hypothetical protein
MLQLGEKFQENVVKVASKFVGEKEKTGNIFDDNTILGKALHKAGQKDGEAWCAYFVEIVYKFVLAPIEEWDTDPNVKLLDKLHSASAVLTFKNFSGDPNGVFEWTKTPSPGDLICFQSYLDGRPLATGHIGIVISATHDQVQTIEGNTSGGGSREGLVVGKMRRAIDFDIPKKGKKLVLIGFITVKK